MTPNNPKEQGKQATHQEAPEQGSGEGSSSRKGRKRLQKKNSKEKNSEGHNHHHHHQHKESELQHSPFNSKNRAKEPKAEAKTIDADINFKELMALGSNSSRAPLDTEQVDHSLGFLSSRVGIAPSRGARFDLPTKFKEETRSNAFLRFKSTSKVKKEKGEQNVNFIVGQYEEIYEEEEEMPPEMTRRGEKDKFELNEESKEGHHFHGPHCSHGSHGSHGDGDSEGEAKGEEIGEDEDAVEVDNLEELDEIRSFGEGGVCVICFANEPDGVNMPCGHGGEIS